MPRSWFKTGLWLSSYSKYGSILLESAFFLDNCILKFASHCEDGGSVISRQNENVIVPKRCKYDLAEIRAELLDPAKAQSFNVHRKERAFSQIEIQDIFEFLHDHKSHLGESRRDGLGYRRVDGSWVTYYLHTNLKFQLNRRKIVRKLIDLAKEADEIEGWGLLQYQGHQLSDTKESQCSPEISNTIPTANRAFTTDGRKPKRIEYFQKNNDSDGDDDFRIRVIELHRVNEGGALLDQYHYDKGSLITIDVMLSSPEVDFTGGEFQTLESGIVKPMMVTQSKSSSLPSSSALANESLESAANTYPNDSGSIRNKDSTICDGGEAQSLQIITLNDQINKNNSNDDGINDDFSASNIITEGGTINPYMRTREFNKGDVIIFPSHKYHCVRPVTSGTRTVLVMELWRGHERACAHRCLRPVEECKYSLLENKLENFLFTALPEVDPW